MFWKGKICPVCKKEFKENEDVVFCPDCGTAHHRDCWQQQNGCFYLEEHTKGNFDTTNEIKKQPNPTFNWEQPKAQGYQNLNPDVQANRSDLMVCPVCGTYNKKEMRLCINCGFEFDPAETEKKSDSHQHKRPSYSSEAEDGVTYQDLVRYTGFMAQDYINKFEDVKKGKVSFSVPGFILSVFWLLYRKMYGVGFAIAAVCVSPILLYKGLIMIGISDTLNTLMSTVTDYSSFNAQYQQAIVDFVSQHPQLNLLFFVSFALLAISMIFTGFMGNRLYYRKAVADIRSIKNRVDDPEKAQMFISMKGGGNIFMPVLLVTLLYVFVA